MNLEGTHIANVLLSIHQADLAQRSRHSALDLSDRIERRVALHQPLARTAFRPGRFLETIRQRLSPVRSVAKPSARPSPDPCV
jgi:hypothetical protein